MGVDDCRGSEEVGETSSCSVVCPQLLPSTRRAVLRPREGSRPQHGHRLPYHHLDSRTVLSDNGKLLTSVVSLSLLRCRYLCPCCRSSPPPVSPLRDTWPTSSTEEAKRAPRIWDIASRETATTDERPQRSSVRLSTNALPSFLTEHLISLSKRTVVVFEMNWSRNENVVLSEWKDASDRRDERTINESVILVPVCAFPLSRFQMALNPFTQFLMHLPRPPARGQTYPECDASVTVILRWPEDIHCRLLDTITRRPRAELKWTIY